MWKQKLGVSLAIEYQKPMPEIIKLVKQIGFDAISPEWSNIDALNLIAEEAKKQGLIIQSLHAPYHGAAQLWSEDDTVNSSALDKIFQSLDGCKKHGIPVLVMHTWIGFTDIPSPTKKGLETYGKIVAKAKKYGVKIAFENTEGFDHFETLMNYFNGEETVGFCWDSGHEICYNYSKDLLAQYGDRLIMTHLNDNLGISKFDGKIFWTDDLHLLPYDGVADWDKIAVRLSKAKSLEILNFELNIRNKPNRYENVCYEKMSIEEYFTEIYKRACRFAYRLLAVKNEI